jgi:hypothetical protein
MQRKTRCQKAGIAILTQVDGQNGFLLCSEKTMKILSREELWIHTHFLTDCTRLPEFRMREIEKIMIPFLRGIGIVYGLHFTQVQDERTCRIVLECIPFPHTLDQIQHRLQEAVQHIPARPPVTKVVTKEQHTSQRSYPH